jgi:ATP-dependent DNA helicase RecG
MSAPLIVTELDFEEADRLLAAVEGHFKDNKSIEITPAKITRTVSAFANAEGGEILVGLDEDNGVFSWRGFEDPEAANGLIATIEPLYPLGSGIVYEFLRSAERHGFVLRIDVPKSAEIRVATDGKAYVRRGAQNLQAVGEALERLRRTKGITSFESELTQASSETITNSLPTLTFMLQVIPLAEPEDWLKKQHLIRDGKPSVAGVVLFAEEPQAILPKRCGIKIHRYNTSDAEGTRANLAFDPISIEGCLYDQITSAVHETAKIIESVRIMTTKGLVQAQYPREALHEIITNAALHRDYSVADDIHIRVFDNRVEVESPGTLPAHITPENILSERFARNGSIVRIINKFPNPPNKDVGEGLNTAFDAMRRMNLKPPIIQQLQASVRVTLPHESLGSPQELIL